MAKIVEYKDIVIAYSEIDANAIEHIQHLSHSEWYEPYLLERKSVKRQLEFANAIILLTDILHHEPHINYTEKGKPYLVNSPYNISISHSKNHIAVAVSQHLVGIDIEPATARILKLAERYMSVREFEVLKSIDNNRSSLPYSAVQYATMVWCGKEAVYKIVGDEAFDYPTSQEIIISPTDSYAIINKSQKRYELSIINNLTDNIILIAHD